MTRDDVLDWFGLLASEACVLAAAATNLYDIQRRYDAGESQDYSTPLAMLVHRLTTLPLLAVRARRSGVHAALAFACACAAISFVLWAVTVGLTLHHDGKPESTYLGVSLGVSLGGGAAFAALAWWGAAPTQFQRV